MNKDKLLLTIVIIATLLCAVWAFVIKDLLMVILSMLSVFLTTCVLIFGMKEN